MVSISRLVQNAKLPEGMDVDVTTLGAMADAQALEIWGEDVARGAPFPVVDQSGGVRA